MGETKKPVFGRKAMHLPEPSVAIASASQLEVGLKKSFLALVAPNLTLEKIAMKKSLIALAVLAASGAASAQSNFTLYGIADAALAREKGATSVNLVKSGQLQGSRFGLRGTEDLGGGLKGVFKIENGFNIDTGSQQQGRLFGREAWVGVEGAFGTVRLGRQYTPLGNVADMVGTKGYDILTLAKTYGADPYYRADNAINYKSPSFSGLTIEGQYSLAVSGKDGKDSTGAETNTGGSPKFGRAAGFNFQYVQGPIRAAVGYIGAEDVNTALDGAQKRAEVMLVGGYNFGVADVTAYYTNTELGNEIKKPAKKMTVFGLQAAFPFGAFTVTPAFAIAKDVKGSNAVAKDNANLFTLQAKYDLSKRTALYGMASVVDNAADSALGFNTPKADSNSYGIQVGVRHSF